MSTLASPLSIAGTRQSGASVRTQNGENPGVLSTSAVRLPAEHVSYSSRVTLSTKNVPEPTRGRAILF